MIRAAAATLALLTLSACGSDSDPGPGEVTQGEARQLNEAAAATDLNTVMQSDGADPGENAAQ